jgi:hypothetical protein
VFTQPKLATFVPDGIARKIHQLRAPAHCVMAFLTRCAKELRKLLHRANAGALRNAYRAAGTARDIAIALAVAVNSMMPRHEQNGHAGEREHLTSPGHRL